MPSSGKHITVARMGRESRSCGGREGYGRRAGGGIPKGAGAVDGYNLRWKFNAGGVAYGSLERKQRKGA